MFPGSVRPPSPAGPGCPSRTDPFLLPRSPGGPAPSSPGRATVVAVFRSPPVSLPFRFSRPGSSSEGGRGPTGRQSRFGAPVAGRRARGEGRLLRAASLKARTGTGTGGERAAAGCPCPGGVGVCVCWRGGGGIPVPSPAGEGAPGVVVGFGRPGGEPPPFPAGPATEPRGGRESRARPCAVVGCARPGALFTCPKTVLKGRVGIAFQRGKAKKPGRRRPRSAGRHRVRACGRARSGGQGLGVSVEPLAGWKFRERRSKVSALSRVSHLLTDANNVSLSEQRYRSSESRC